MLPSKTTRHLQNGHNRHISARNGNAVARHMHTPKVAARMWRKVRADWTWMIAIVWFAADGLQEREVKEIARQMRTGRKENYWKSSWRVDSRLLASGKFECRL